jgi:hypothetical protein
VAVLPPFDRGTAVVQPVLDTLDLVAADVVQQVERIGA